MQIGQDSASIVEAVQAAIQRKQEIELEYQLSVGGTIFAGLDRPASDIVLYEIAAVVHKHSMKNSDTDTDEDVAIQGRQLIDEYT